MASITPDQDIVPDLSGIRVRNKERKKKLNYTYQEAAAFHYLAYTGKIPTQDQIDELIQMMIYVEDNYS